MRQEFAGWEICHAVGPRVSSGNGLNAGRRLIAYEKLINCTLGRQRSVGGELLVACGANGELLPATTPRVCRDAMAVVDRYLCHRCDVGPSEECYKPRRRATLVNRLVVGYRIPTTVA